MPPKDDAALASALARLIEDNDLRKAMADRGLAHVQEFSWDKVSTRVMSVYQEATVARRDGALSTPRLGSSVTLPAIMQRHAPMRLRNEE